jgi:HKD family nuclease
VAKKEFILQGLTNQTHVSAVREIFDVPKVERVVLSVAFVTESGVDLLAKQIEDCASHVVVFAGIRNDITSRQGLARLLGLGVNLYAVDTGSRNVLFHPKLYLARGENRARLVIGSANLTIGGLNNNIEAGMLLEFDLNDDDDKAVVDAIEDRFRVLPKEYPGHVLKIGSAKLLDEMQASGRVVDEMALPPPRPSTSASSGSSDPVSRIKLKVKPLRRALAAAKKAAPKPAKPPATVSTPTSAPTPVIVGVGPELVWESAPLTERDLNIPKGTNTNKTGNMNFDKGELPDGVDFRHYFRDVVFPSLPWMPSTRKGSKDREIATGWFQLVMKGVNYGEFQLQVRHSKSTTSKTYLQGNASTSLSWGSMKNYVAKSDLLGRTLALYRDKVDPTRFVLEID